MTQYIPCSHFCSLFLDLLLFWNLCSAQAYFVICRCIVEFLGLLILYFIFPVLLSYSLLQWGRGVLKVTLGNIVISLANTLFHKPSPSSRITLLFSSVHCSFVYLNAVIFYGHSSDHCSNVTTFTPGSPLVLERDFSVTVEFAVC